MMKKIIIVFSMMLISSISFGQNKPKSMKERRDSIFTVMKLSDENRQKMHDLIAERGNDSKAISQDATLTDEQKAEKKKNFNKTLLGKEKTILTAEQSQIWADFAKAVREKNKPKQ
jgi:Spy/CpxP family protein refolding chaperone